MAKAFNENYPYTLLYNIRAEIHFDNYSLATSKHPAFEYSTTSATHFPFEALNYSGANPYDNKASFNFAYLSYCNATNTDIVKVPLDLIVNRQALINIANYMNSQGKDLDINTAYGGSYIKKINKENNFYDVLKYYQQIYQLSPYINDKYCGKTTSLTNQNIYYELYNDKDSNVYYADHISRGAAKTAISLDSNKRLPSIIPIFTCKTSNPNTMFYIRIRNLDIPMKRVQTSKNGSYYTFMFIYPQYILTQYSQYKSSIQYIYTRDTNGIQNIWYSDVTWNYDTMSDTSVISNTQKVQFQS